MTSESPLGDVLGRRLRAFEDNLPSVGQGDVEAVHRTRVASRRIREALPVIAQSLSPAELRKAKRRARRITAALGRVRELDVTLAVLDEIEQASPERRVALELVRAHLRRERDDVEGEMRQRLHALKPGRFVHRIARRVEDLDANGAGNWRAVLETRLARRAGRLTAAIENAGTVYLPDRIHAVRIATKKLRYVLELAHESATAPARGRVARLKRMQDCLGRLHDLEVLAHHIRQVQDTPATSTSSMRWLDQTVAELHHECRTLHGAYLRGRGQLVEICAAARADALREGRSEADRGATTAG